jgi:serine/threonine-protein kinase
VHAQLLHDEFGAQPDADVEALAARLRQSSGTVRAPLAPLPAAASADHTAGAEPSKPPRVRRQRWIIAAALAAIILPVVIWQTTRDDEAGSGGETMPSIGVLPFFNSSDSMVVFSDGLSDEIINTLSRVPDVRVASRNSSFTFRGPQDMRAVARKLNVNHVLEGTVRTSTGRLKVTARLIDADKGQVVWSDRYDRRYEVADVISIQEEIAQSVVRALAARFELDIAPAPSMRPPTTDKKAFDYFVTGRHYYHRRNVPELLRALALFDSAIARDPNYARAHASKAEVYALLGAYDYGALAPKAAYPAARAAAERALEIDPDLAEAHNALGAVLFNYEWDWTAAERAFERAIQLSPGYALAHHWYSLLLQCSGRRSEALHEIMRAREVDPLSSVIATALGRHLYLSRDFDAAYARLNATVAADSGFVTARVALGMTLTMRGDHKRAIEQYEIGQRVLGQPVPLISALIANAYGRAGQPEKAQPYLQQLRNIAATRYVPAEYIAVAETGLGNHAAALAALEQAFANRSGGTAYLEIEPLIDPLRNATRMNDLIWKIHAARK